MLAHFDARFFALNADLPWMDARIEPYRMAKLGCRKMDALLLLMQTARREVSSQGRFRIRERWSRWRKDLRAGPMSGSRRKL